MRWLLAVLRYGPTQATGADPAVAQAGLLLRLALACAPRSMKCTLCGEPTCAESINVLVRLRSVRRGRPASDASPSRRKTRWDADPVLAVGRARAPHTDRL